MAFGSRDHATRAVRRMATVIALDGLSDGQLLARFIDQRDEEAFAELVRRHGSMVMTTCRRMVGNTYDAEDAFQAVFVILVRKAKSMTDRATVGNWLYGVAHNTALKAKAIAARRRSKEAAASRMETQSETNGSDDLAEYLHLELNRLPEKQREALVLCDLEDRPRREVAELLGIPEGTLSSRLAAGKKQLAARLARHGLALSAVGFGGTQSLAAAQIESAVRAAAIAAGFATGPITAAVMSITQGRPFLMRISQCVTGLAVVALIAAIGIASNSTRRELKVEDQPPKLAADKIEDGVYLLLFEGEGKKVRLADGYEGILGKRVSESIGVGGKLQSVSNDNTRFIFKVNKLGPLPNEVTDQQTALVVDGLIFHLGRPEKLADDGITNSWVNVYSAEVARVLAARYKVEPELRKHPGHRYEVRWLPDKQEYRVGETITLKMELKNTGTGPLRFTFGGKQRGARNNQFRFIAQTGNGWGKSVPDIGDPLNFGGISTSNTLKPGETFTADVDLSKWFSFSQPDTYRITGVFEMPVIDPESSDGFSPLIWDDLVVGECLVRVTGKGK